MPSRPGTSRPKSHPVARLLAAAVGLVLTAPVAAQEVAPEAASPGLANHEGPTTATRHMVAAANPYATAAGLGILRAGGSAVDAAIAAQLVLNLVEPQSSGIGGGAFLLHYAGQDGALSAYDGRETAPAAATPALFLTPDGAPMGFWEAVVGGRSVGVPGLLRLLEMAHQDHGRLAWATLFKPAIRLARDGFAVSPRLHALVSGDQHLKSNPAAAAYFHDADGTAKPIGTLLRNPDLAETLEAIAAGGASAFYEGPIAADIVAAVTGAADNPGALSLADLGGYHAVKRDVLCAPYRAWQVCGMPPPTSGGVAVLQTLGILAHFDLAAAGSRSAGGIHLVAEASRLAFADRNHYLADADFVDVPVKRLLEPDYLAERAALISPMQSLGTATPGLEDRKAAAPAQIEPPATTHLSVVDQWGNAVSMTSSIENAFGTRLMVRGFLLNNQLTDFSFRPEVDGEPVANRVEPGKRPRSSMSPTLVLDQDGRLVMAIGSPGGSRIIGYVVKTLVGVLDWGMDIQAAISLPHFVNRNGPTDLEAETTLTGLAEPLSALGHEVRESVMTSGLHGIWIGPDGLQGGADPRREGVARGD